MKTCKKCNTEKETNDFYRGETTCKACKYLRMIETKEIRDSKLTNCNSCDREFGDNLKVLAKGLCSLCYNKKWRETKVNETCADCNVIFNSGGRLTEILSGGRCRRCYDKWRKSRLKYECLSCGGSIPNGSIKAKCPKCLDKSKFDEEQAWAISQDVELKGHNDLNKEQYESIRRFLIKYNRDMFDITDSFKVAYLFDQVFGYVKGLDNSGVDTQIFLMLRRLKKVWLLYENKF